MWSPACRLAALFSLFSLLGQSDAYEYSLSNGGKADDRVVCAGSLPVEFFLISATDDLTRFCVETIGTLCYRSLSPNPPLIFTVPSQRIFGNVFLNGARAKQICSVKCHCSGYSSTDIAVIPDLATLGQPLTPSTDWAIPWHFDLPTHISPRMRIRLGQKNNILYELVEGDAQPISVTGDLVNRPDCAGEELSSALISGLSAAFIGGRVPYLNYTQLCAHHYYGGHNRTNAGGICVHDRHDPESEREFALPYETKSPLFSGDLDDAASPALLALPASVDRECRQACSCSHLVPKQKQEDFGRNYASEVDLHVPHPYEDDGRFRPTAEEELEDQLQLEGTCSGSCTRRSSCGRGCQCFAMEQIDPRMFWPSLSIRTYQATCRPKPKRSRLAAVSKLNPMGRKGQILNVGIACPCNTTYVSRACCESEDGVIWEPNEFKLGEMAGK